ncbi:OprD family porin [Pseudomonas frederiksbergensis]|uniref:Porin n=1 Tax=Pseudomonas frederiksbergensis TaxID=104087 RepID=A0A423KG40_9PSED|nr:OprD family porin [Pseudomonas frederiksbergensis]RON51786.1 porin [Pseudomonas frederiksbergensis]
MSHQKYNLYHVMCVALAIPFCARASESGFIEDATGTLSARNFYFNRDFSGSKVAQSKSEEWAQGFVLNLKSGYTPGTVGFGVDTIGQWGIKLDSGRGRSNSGLLPVHDGQAADEYSRAGAALKMRVSKTELKVGELQPNLPVLLLSDNRLLPPTYQGASIVTNEIEGLTVQAGRLNTTSLRNEAGDERLQPMIAFTLRPVSADHFTYVGGDYSFNNNRTAVGLWYAGLEDIYNQRFFSFRHSQPLGSWTLGGNLGYFDTQETGRDLAGEVDNRALYGRVSAQHGAHTLSVGHQAMFGQQGFARVYANLSPLANEVTVSTFDAADEKSWQLRYDYDFAGLGIPGLQSMARYTHGGNADVSTLSTGVSGSTWERNLELAYTIQSGKLKNLNVRWRNSSVRSNWRTDIDENRLVFNYAMNLF